MKLSDTARSRLTASAMVVVGLGLVASSAYAGTGGDEFSDIYDMIVEWMQGTLGRLLIVAMTLVGIAASIVRQSLWTFAVSLGGGLGLYTTPTVIESVMAATISTPAAQTFIQLSNGLM